MAWSTPPTWVAGQAITAAQLNIFRDDLLETAPAKATAAGRIFVSTGPNAIAEREILDHVVETLETTTSTSYTSLATNGPIVTITTGTKAMTWINAMQANSTSGQGCYSSLEITGATTSAVIDGRAVFHQNDANWDARGGVCSLFTLTPGVNTFRMLYKVQGGTGSFRMRRLQVMGL